MREAYDDVKLLGNGAYGVVREVKCKRTGKRYAAKTVPAAAEGELLMLKLRHSHVVCLEHVILQPPEMHLLLSVCGGGDLSNWSHGGNGSR